VRAVYYCTYRSVVPSHVDVPDEALVKCAQQDEGAAWETLVGRFSGLVRSQAAVFFFPGGDPEDVVQEGMIGLCKAVRDYRADRQVPFALFARVCIRRQIMTAVKGALRGKHRPLNTARSLDEMLGPDEPARRTLLSVIPLVADGPDAVALRQLEDGALEMWMRKTLSPLERAAARGYLEGHSYDAIARTVGCSIKAVDNALQRARCKLGRTGPSRSVDSQSAARRSQLGSTPNLHACRGAIDSRSGLDLRRHVTRAGLGGGSPTRASRRNGYGLAGEAVAR